MSNRASILFLLLPLLLVAKTDAKDKKQSLLPLYVLQAQTVAVVVHPDANEPLTDPMANRTAQAQAEKAIREWGRFNVVLDAQTADLIIAVRKGHKGGPTVSHSPADKPIDYSNRRQLTLGAQRGYPQSPNLTDPDPGNLGVPDRGPQIGSQIGASEDTFEVYRGGVEYPLDTSPVWRYIAKGALNPPQVTAIEQFRKAIEESEKQHSQARKP